jgi:isoleucyl-tRNA synthetase
MDWKSTLHLPNPDFTIPMKADLPEREPKIAARWAEMGIYHKIQEARKDAEVFVLHDGPPYTNSPIHIGTAMNKLLKDLVVKGQSLLGKRAPYVPGFDNHGLPIEQAVMKVWKAELKDAGEPAMDAFMGSPAPHGDAQISRQMASATHIKELRTRARNHAAKYRDIQSEQFQRLGVFGLWEKPYETMSFRYEAEIVRVFGRMAKQGYVYRGLRPVIWSPTSRTALADTEVVYKDYVSKAIYVRFALAEDPAGRFAKYSDLHTIIWTTTPWTLPGNVACAFHPDLNYVVMQAGDLKYIILEDLAEKVATVCGLGTPTVLETFSGSEVQGISFQHPFLDRKSVAVLAEYVTSEDGTGVVHTAPGHGRDDFHTGMANHLAILCPVDEQGVLTIDAGPFAGMYYLKANAAIIAHLSETGALLNVSNYAHSYPHGERDEMPIIFRTTEQWFVSMEANNLREKMLSETDKVRWMPDGARNRFESMLANRPDWCISRQRPWGVGIPVLYGKQSGEPVLDEEVIEAVAQLIEREGSDAWWLREPSEFLPAGYAHPTTGETEFRKETDVFDVWFDSGATHLCVLEGNVEPEWKEKLPVDLYLEGSDQHRGWFNTSMIVGVCCRGEAPYRAVLTHGFIVDEDKEKVSKRKGNALDPQEACARFGADILRYWVATVDATDDVVWGEHIMTQVGENYRSIRNSLRFLLGNLEGFVAQPGEKPTLAVDQFIVAAVDQLAIDVRNHLANYDTMNMMKQVLLFCNVTLSRFYLDAIKDRMYCDGRDWASRRSAQVASAYVLLQLVRMITPVLVHTAEEVYDRLDLPNKLESVHLETLAAPPTPDQDILNLFAALLEIRGQAFAALEEQKATLGVKNGQDLVCTLTTSESNATLLARLGDDLANLFKMSEVVVKIGEPSIEFQVSAHPMCERSRVRRADTAARSLKDGSVAMLSDRDARVALELGLLAPA